MKLGSMLLVTLLAAGATVEGQSLGELAQKEKEKREAKAKEASAKTAKPGAKAPEAKVYTGDDLVVYAEKQPAPAAPADGDEGALAPPSGPVADEQAPRPAEPDDPAERARLEKAWRQRAQSVRAAVASAEKEVAAAEKIKAGLGIGPQVDDPNVRRAYGIQVREADERVTRAKSALASAKSNLANLEDEARRQGALPGWLR